MFNTKSTFWVRAALINLSIVALLGAVMRYKIGFELPWFDQKFLQEAHSHFAFAGWITHSLYFLIIRLFHSNLDSIREKVYSRILLFNLISAYGMLICFSFQGYGPVSLFFSTVSVITGYVFSWFALKDAGRLSSTHLSKNWIKAAIWFGILSTMGTMVLSFMMATHRFDQTIYLGSIYFYLHFQYNGWFLFACMGLLLDKIKHILPSSTRLRNTFWLFFLAGIPSYFLSTLWAHLSAWLYGIVILAAIMQVIGWANFLRLLYNHVDQLKASFTKLPRILFIGIGSALTIKLLLQLCSTIPIISKLAFGFRPIVIAYLHLVLLVIVSLFLLTFMYVNGLLQHTRRTTLAIVGFTSGIILNETVLSIQGIAAFSYTVIPYADQLLFAIAGLIVSSLLLLVSDQIKPFKT